MRNQALKQALKQGRTKEHRRTVKHLLSNSIQSIGTNNKLFYIWKPFPSFTSTARNRIIWGWNDTVDFLTRSGIKDIPFEQNADNGEIV